MQLLSEKKQSLEHKLNFVIGTILLLNLYLLSGILRMPYLPILILCMGISFYYLIKGFKRAVFFSLINNWNTLFYIVISVFLLLLQFAFVDKVNEVKINDSIRILIYCMYFSWTAFLYADAQQLKKFIFKIAFVSFIILFLEAIVEIYDPFLFALFLSENVSKTMLRVGGTFADANAFSNAVVILGFMILKFMPTLSKKQQIALSVFVFLCMLYLVELSGSRQGILLLMVLSIYFTPTILRQFTPKKILLFLALIVLIILLLSPVIYQYLLNNPDSSLARVLFDTENPKSINSDLERSSAMTAGLNYIKNHFYLYGTGMFLFENEWTQYVQVQIPFPHNSFVFLYCQYGILAVLIFYFFWIAIKRAFTQNLWPLVVMLFIQMYLLSNPVYYPMHFFTLFVVDVCWINAVFKNSLTQPEMQQNG